MPAQLRPIATPQRKRKSIVAASPMMIADTQETEDMAKQLAHKYRAMVSTSSETQPLEQPVWGAGGTYCTEG